jgi:hypothetical protein
LPYHRGTSKIFANRRSRSQFATWFDRVDRTSSAAYEANARGRGSAGFHLQDLGDGVAAATLASDQDLVVLRHRASSGLDGERVPHTSGLNLLSVPQLRSTLLRALGGGPERASPPTVRPGRAKQPAHSVVRPLRLADGR